jgi:hypothetical protein
MMFVMPLRVMVVVMLSFGAIAAARAGAVKPAEITKIAEKLAADEKTYGASGDQTQCNRFARDMINGLLNATVAVLEGTANDQFDKLSSSPQWKAMGFAASGNKAELFQKAQDFANDGELVLVVYKNPTPNGHGHIAVVVPGVPVTSGNWKMKVPMVAQAGQKNPAKKVGEEDISVFARLELSYAFAPDKAANMEVFVYTGK